MTATGADGVSLDIESNAAADPTQQAAMRLHLTLFTQRLRYRFMRIVEFPMTTPERKVTSDGKIFD